MKTPNNTVIPLPAPWASRQGAAAVLVSLACLPMGGCVVLGGGDLKHEAREQMTLSEPAGARKLVLRNVVGDLVITADPTATEISATAVMIGKGRTVQNAQEALDEIVVSLDPSRGDPGTIEALAEHPSGSSRKGYAVDWRITAPPALEIEIRNDVGDIDLRGFAGPAFIESAVGDIEAAEIAQGLTIKGGVGDVNARSGGPIRVETDVGDARVAVLGSPQPINVTTDVGEITLTLPDQWVGSFDAETDTGDVDVSLPGMPVSITRARDHRARGSIGGDGPAITLSADVGDIEIRRADAR